MSLQGKIQVSMHGAAGEVTGSCTLVEMEGLRFLVDSGMFQGGGDAYGKNQRALAFDVRHLDFVLLTHAHIDHSGLLPRLAMLGYRGPIYATAATTDLLQVLLLDSAHIQEKESEWQLRRSHRSGRGGRGLQPPLYTVTQAQECLKLLRAVDYDTPLHPASGVSVRFRDAGHILGSAILEVQIDTADGPRKLVFSGDLGQPGRPVLRDPEFIAEADLLCIESTYGNRVHRPLEDTEAELIRAFEHTFGEKRGNIIIPAFAVGRTQEILYVLGGLVRQGRLPHLKIYVDSPMADAATRITLKYRHLWDDETRDLMAWQEANPQAVRVHFTADVEESMALNDIREGAEIDPTTPEKFAELADNQANEFLGQVEQLCQANAVPCTKVAVTSDIPYEAIIETAEKSACDLIFMASHGRKGITGLLLGSETNKVLTHSKVPVLVYR